MPGTDRECNRILAAAWSRNALGLSQFAGANAARLFAIGPVRVPGKISATLGCGRDQPG